MASDGTTINLCGEKLTPDPLGALYWPAQGVLVVSDLHFEKGASFARRGVMLPPYDTRTTLTRLSALLLRYQPTQVISLGDAFHDDAAEVGMGDGDADRLEAMVGGCDWIWILGNHDPEPPKRFAAATVQELAIGPLIFRHEPQMGAVPGEIAGHLHPCARIVSEGRTVRRRCFATGGERLIMPAMGAYTGGLNVLDEAYTPLLGPVTAWVLGENGVYPIGDNCLAPDATPVTPRRIGG